jgi:hypothetical protein
MEKTVWKFSFTPDDDIEIDMPEGAQILTVQIQFEQPCIWALVDPKSKLKKKRFKLIGTGHPIEINDIVDYRYVGTFQLMEGQLVFHLFERL